MHTSSQSPLLHPRASTAFATVTSPMTAYHELIAAVLREEIVANMACAKSEKRIKYATPEALIAENPNCRLVTRAMTRF